MFISVDYDSNSCDGLTDESCHGGNVLWTKHWKGERRGEGSDDVKDELDLHKHMVAMVGVVMVAITHMVKMVFILKGRSLEWQRVERHEGAD